uniref:protein-tyrosine-phosphatase n=1 Tax=Ornithorhynchus anatinus TaxID=9258 RepID=F7BB84_ORNAN
MSRSLENVRGFLAQVDARGGQEEAVIAGEFNVSSSRPSPLGLQGSPTREKQLNPDVLLRSMTVTFQRVSDTRTLSQFHYMAWPDRGIPDNTGHFLSMVEEARRTKGDDPAPLCVHCSAGCGRTGVICTVDYVRHLLLKQRIPPNFSIFDIVLEMRRQRPSAVQTQVRARQRWSRLGEGGFSLLTPPNMSERRCSQTQLDLVLLFSPLSPRSISVPGEPVGPLPPTEPARGMNDTYAVVHKRGPPPPSSESKPREPQYDNVTAGGSAPAEVPLYSTVRSRGQRGASPEQAPPELRVPRPTNSLPGSERWEDGSLGSPRCALTSLLPPSSGFNIRIGKPKGPRDPPAEWSRV